MDYKQLLLHTSYGCLTTELESTTWKELVHKTETAAHTSMRSIYKLLNGCAHASNVLLLNDKQEKMVINPETRQLLNSNKCRSPTCNSQAKIFWEKKNNYADTQH